MRSFWAICAAREVFGELGRRFERVESLVCEPAAIFCFGYDDSMRQAMHVGCLGLIFLAGAAYRRPRPKSGGDLGKTSSLFFSHAFSMFMFRGARNVLSKIQHVLAHLAQPSRDFVHVGSLSSWRGANFEITRATLWWCCACQIALAMAVRILTWLAQASRHFLRARSLSRRIILVASHRFWQNPSTTILQEFHVRPSCMTLQWGDLVEILVKSSLVQVLVVEIPMKSLWEVLAWCCTGSYGILLKSSKRSLHDLAQALLRKSCRDPDEIL